MASSAVLDFEKLTAPISDAAPAGAELKEDAALSSIYYKVKDARDSARKAEKDLADFQMLADDEKKKAKQPEPNWKLVIELSIDTITKHSKDLWINAWLIEGLCRIHGFAGLRDGFRLARELIERYWEGIHPVPDEDGVATTVAQFAGLNGSETTGALIGPIEAIPITDGSDASYTSRDYIHAAKLQSEPERLSQYLRRGGASLDTILKSASETAPEFSATLLEDVQQTIDEFQLLTEAFDSRCGSNAPQSSQIKTALADCRDRLTAIYKNESSAVADVEAEAGGANVPSVSGGQPVASGRVATRDDAFRLLMQVADFFRRTEPHSPVSYALEQAVRWGRMSLPELLTDLISDSGAREEMFRRAGIPKPKSDD